MAATTPSFPSPFHFPVLRLIKGAIMVDLIFGEKSKGHFGTIYCKRVLAVPLHILLHLNTI